MKKLVSIITITFLMAFVAQVKGPMIVVQGSIQLWPVTIINNSGITLVAIDEIIDPEGTSHIMRILPPVNPNNQFTFQWPSTFSNPNARKITIYGAYHAVGHTNRIIIGNTSDATHPMVPGGSFSIIRLSDRVIAIGDPLNTYQAAGR